MKLNVRYAVLADVGRVLQGNEDNWTADAVQGLFTAVDGMGGEFAGTLASKGVLERLPGLVRQHFGARHAESDRLPGSNVLKGKTIARDLGLRLGICRQVSVVLLN